MKPLADRIAALHSQYEIDRYRGRQPARNLHEAMQIITELEAILKNINDTRHADNSIHRFVPNRTNKAIDIAEKVIEGEH